MAQRLAGESTNSKFDTQRPEKEITTTTIGTKTMLDTSIGSLTSFIDTGNSTETPLPANTGGSDHIFTGETIDVTNVAEIRIAIVTDAKSAIDGLNLQTSKDGVNWYWDDPYTILGPNYREEISFTPNTQYFRIVYINGTVAQTYFQISVLLKSTRGKPSSHRLKDTLSEQDDVEAIKAALAYQNTNDGIVSNVSIQNPIPADGDSVYSKDIWIQESDTTDWVDIDNSGEDVAVTPFTNLHTRISNSTTDNPKVLFLHLNRTVNANQIGLGCTGGGNYSNVKITLIGSGGVERAVMDDSANNEKRTSYNYQFTPELFNAIRLEFYTADPICISNMTVQKVLSTTARLQGVRDDGTVGNVVISNSNRLRTVSQPYTYAVAEGDIAGHIPLRRFGHNPSVGTSIETVSTTSTLYTYLTTAEYLRIVSTSTSDDIAGVGMQSIFIQGLDQDYNIVNEIVELDGTTPVYTTTHQYIRLLAAYGQQVGTTPGNVGTITISNNAGTNILGTLPIGEGRWNAAVMTVPAGGEVYITNWYGSENSSKGSEISMWKREFGDGGWQLIRLYTLLDNIFENEIKTPLVFGEKTDIEIRAQSNLGGANVAAGFYGWIE